jgi:hypothetical protein
VYRIVHSPAARFFNSVTGLVSPLEDFELLSAIFEHLRHKRQLIQSAVFVKRLQNFVFAPDLNNVSDPEIQHKLALPIITLHLFSLYLQYILQLRNLRENRCR